MNAVVVPRVCRVAGDGESRCRGRKTHSTAAKPPTGFRIQPGHKNPIPERAPIALKLDAAPVCPAGYSPLPARGLPRITRYPGNTTKNFKASPLAKGLSQYCVARDSCTFSVLFSVLQRFEAAARLSILLFPVAVFCALHYSYSYRCRRPFHGKGRDCFPKALGNRAKPPIRSANW